MPLDHLRDWQLVTLTGWTLDQIDDASVERCDWLLAIEATVKDIQRKKGSQ
ncbi:MAG: hypothetical protein ACYDAD_11195 [Acidimicrobiales bacterium]